MSDCYPFYYKRPIFAAFIIYMQMIKKIVSVVFFIVIFNGITFGQTTDSRQTLNKYVQYANENAHGMLIVHRLLEIYNQELNKYVDLEGYPLNFITNDDFDENIFEDKGKMYYRASPHQLLKEALSATAQHFPQDKSDFERIGMNMKTITDSLNQLRFQVERKLAGDLTSMNNVAEIYRLLETGVRLYDDYEQKRKELSVLISKYAVAPKNSEIANIYNLYKEWSVQLHGAFDMLRKEENIPATFYQRISAQSKKVISSLDLYTKNNTLDSAKLIEIDMIKSKVQSAATDLNNYRTGVKIPERYSQYGNGYYYYNIALASAVNKYGTGCTAEFNNWLQDNSSELIFFFERPHFYKVIYPQQKEKLEVLAENVPDNAPRVIENRTVVMSKSKVIKSPTNTIRIELFDHQEIDGDIVSINYNGRWILREYELQRKPRVLSLPVEQGDNYLVLFAENLGQKPPNTMAIRYAEKGERKVMILNSDLKHSEMIIIRSDF